MFRTSTLVAAAFFLFAENPLSAQCSYVKCTIPNPVSSAHDACILPGPQALHCYYGSTLDTDPVSFPPWCGGLDNNQWFAFKADDTEVSFNITVFDCFYHLLNGSCIQAAIYKTYDCNNFQFVSDCLSYIASGTTATLTADSLTPGNIYYLMIDGCTGALCDFLISNASSSTISGPTNYCVAAPPATYNTPKAGTWTIVPPGAGTILGANTGTSVTVDWLQPDTAQLCFQASDCDAPPVCIDVAVRQSPGVAVVPTDPVVCKAGCLGVTFQFEGSPPFAFTWRVLQNGQVLFTQDETAAGFEKTVQVCPADFNPPLTGPVEFRILNLKDQHCGCPD